MVYKLLNLFSPPLVLYDEVPSAIPSLKLYRVDSNAIRQRDVQGMYLLQRYATGDPDAITSQQRRVERLKLEMFPTSVAELVDTAGTVGCLVDVPHINHIRPLVTYLQDASPRINEMVALLEKLAGYLKNWNDVRDLKREAFNLRDWLRQYTPFSSATTIHDTISIGNRVYRNPVAWVMNDALWSTNQSLLMPMGIMHGQLDVSHVYIAKNEPVLMDVRTLDEQGPILLDWTMLELSVLQQFMLERASWEEWVGLCSHICTAITPNPHDIAGFIASHALQIILPLRQSIKAYMDAMHSTLGERIETAYWMCGTIAALRAFADPQASDLYRKAALVYGTLAFAQVAEAFNLPTTDSTQIEVLAPTQPLAQIAIVHGIRPVQPFEHGYALVIGVGETKNPKYSLPITANDALAVKEFLTKRAGYLSEQVKVLTDEQAAIPTIQAAFDWLREKVRVDANATAIVYYSGHGMATTTDDYFFIPHEYNPHDFLSTALNMSMFNTWLQDVSAQRMVVFLDCCHAGGAVLTKDVFQADLIPKAINPQLLAGSGRALIASSTETQSSYILGGHHNSLFTEVLIEAMSHPGEVEVLDVFRLLREEVKRRALSVGKEQQPRFSTPQMDKIVLLVNE
ncbi:MAG: caspase family protein [Anaerolineales bacterium]|nr:caspase family protein [Anaerolineales bacterium]